MSNRAPQNLTPLDPLYADIREILTQARSAAYRAVNFAMVQAYWHVGRLIVEHEQGGVTRAKYGKRVLQELSGRLTAEFGKGFSVQSLWNMRQFYTTFAKLSPLRRECQRSLEDGETGLDTNTLEKLSPPRRELATGPKCDAVRSESEPAASLPSTLRRELSWTHYRLLMRVEDERAREWYMNEAADQQWSTRQLDRQISTLYYDRLLASRDQAPVRAEAEKKIAQLGPEHFIRDPYVLEFLDLKDYPGLRETEIETALVGNLQAFLLELGKGFAFVARQKRIRLDEDDFYVDLVFYNFLLKCFVLIDLKTGKLTHHDIGQMDTYVRLYEDRFRGEADNPTIGIILASDKNDTLVRYSVLHESQQLFATRYRLVLPSEEELRRELQRERALLEQRLEDRAP